MRNDVSLLQLGIYEVIGQSEIYSAASFVNSTSHHEKSHTEFAQTKIAGPFEVLCSRFKCLRLSIRTKPRTVREKIQQVILDASSEKRGQLLDPGQLGQLELPTLHLSHILVNTDADLASESHAFSQGKHWTQNWHTPSTKVIILTSRLRIFLIKLVKGNQYDSNQRSRIPAGQITSRTSWVQCHHSVGCS